MILPVVLYQAPHEKKSVERLIRFCKELDGTEIRVFTAPEPENMRYPEVANWSFRYVAEQMKGKPFLWIEADCAPLKAGWAKEISDEYKRVGKEYLYPAQMNPPFDNFTGIGVQGPNAFEHAPVGFTTGGFDEWIVRTYPDLVGRTHLIRHSYGHYDSKGDATLHEFPRDMSVIGDKAVLFHKDQSNSLLDVILPNRGFKEQIWNISHCGDGGDLIVCLSTLQHKGGLHDIYLRDNGQTAGITHRAHLFKALLEAQPYINSVRIWKREPINWISENFRKYRYHNNGLNLATNHAQAALHDGFITEMPDTGKQWLFVEPNKKWSDRVIINRTERYQNSTFPWKKIVNHYGKKLAFIGTSHEHSLFQAAFGEVEFIHTPNMLIVAQMIAGSALFIGNQSCCMTIAEGLKHHRIQEVCSWLPDCLYAGPNAQYSADGSMTLPAVGDTPELVVERTKPKPEVNINETPPGMWQYPDCPTQMSPHVVITFMRQNNPKMSKDEAMEALIDYNSKRIPSWFDNMTLDPELKKFMFAKRNAGIA